MKIFKVNSARLTNIKRPQGNNITVFIKDNETYLGLSRNYDNHGNYNNDDNSLYKVSNRKASFYLLSSTYTPEAIKELMNTGSLIQKDLEEANKAKELYSNNLYNETGKKEGFWIEFENMKDEIATGIYDNGQKKDEWRYYSADNLLKIETYKDNILNGSVITFNSNNNQIEKSLNYKDGKLEGNCKEYYFGELKFDREYKNGMLNGQAKEYSLYSDGTSQCHEGYYVNDEKQGLWKEYDKNGLLHSTQNYTDDREDGIYKQFDEKGNITYTEEWEYGEQLNSIEYYPNGNIQRVEQWAEGTRNGIANSFYESGEKHEEYNYKDGEVDGKAFTYDKDGSVSKYEIFSNGELIKEFSKEEFKELQNKNEDINLWEKLSEDKSSDLER